MKKSINSIFCVIILIFFTNSVSSDINFFYKGIKSYRQHDYILAKEYFEKAAAIGDNEAQFLLGRMYFDGNSLKIDHVQSLKWFFISHSSGLIIAKRYIKKLKLRMSMEEITEARERAQDWIKENQRKTK